MNPIRQTQTSIRRACGRALLAAALAATGMVHAADYYVDVDWTGTQSGTASAPYKTIKAAANAANALTGPHNIYIAAGWYGDVANSGTEDYSAGGGVGGGILLSQRIYLYGGYAGWDGDGAGAEDFNWSAGARVPRATIIDLQGAASRAFQSTGAIAYVTTALFDGLVFRHANHTANGGAIAHTPVNYGCIVINDCLFTNNVTTANGGAVYAAVPFDSQTITASEFIGNQAANGGAFFENGHDSLLTFEDCLFRTNTVTAHGGAIYIGGTSGDLAIKTIRRSRLESNTALTAGGAFSYGNNAIVVAERTVFSGNAAPTGAATFGRDWWMGSLTLRNCLVVGHTGGYAIHAVGNVYNRAYPLMMVHCTVVGNANGGVRFADNNGSRRSTIQNSIFANNGAYAIYRARVADTAPLLEYNNVTNNTSGGYFQCAAGVGSISNDPQFVNAAGGDFRLAKGSPCIDTGTNLGITTDLDGAGRPTRLGYDMGCYEEWQIPIIASRAPLATDTAAEVRAEFTYESADIATYAYFVVDTSDKGTNSLAAWSLSVSVGERTQGTIFGTTFSGLSPATTYWYRCMASNSYDVIWGPVAWFTTPSAGGATRLWTGLGGNTLASNTNNWQEGLAPAAGDYVLLDSSPSNMTWDAGVNGLPGTVARWTQTEKYTGTVTFPTTYPTFSAVFTNFTIAGDAALFGGKWAQTVNPANNTPTYRLSMRVDGDLTIGAFGLIDVDSLGFQVNYGPGKGSGDDQGPSHAGQGGYKQVSLPAPTYGSAFEPITLGSGGNSGGGGGPGGGAVLLHVVGKAHIDGSILARGGYRIANKDYRPGSGGSIWLTAAELSGSGTLDVRGSAGSILNAWPGGGGGRIAVVLKSGSTFGLITFRASGQPGTSAAVTGAAGTIYLQKSAQAAGAGRLIIDNGGLSLLVHAVTQPAEAMNLSALEAVVVTNGGALAVTTDTSIDFATATVTGGGELKIRSTAAVAFPASFILTNTYRLCLDVPVSATGDWTIMSNAVVTHSQSYYGGINPEKQITLALTGNLTLAAGGAIDLRDRGYVGGTGPGAGTSDSINSSHGGYGMSSGALRPTYGSVLQPSTRGSGNVTGTGQYHGAGAAELVVSGAMILDGTIHANSIGFRASAAGSVYIRAGMLSGKGLVDASAGAASGTAGAGGGRIAVVLTGGTSYGSVVFRAFGGDGTAAQDGAAGTIYRQTAADGAGGGTVLVANNNLATNVFTPLPGFAASLENVSKTRWVAQGAGKIGLLAHAAVESLTLGAGSYLELAGKTLTLGSLSITNRNFGAGSYSAAALGPLVTDSSGGTGLVIIKARGTVLLLR